MKSTRSLPGLSLCLLSVVTPAAVLSVLPAGQAWSQEANSADTLWANFAHFTLVAKPEQAAAAATALVADSVERGALLDAVESSGYRTQVPAVMRRAKGMSGLGEVADQLDAKLNQARADRAEEEPRIKDAVQKLAVGQRARANALSFLKQSGQYAAPELLRVITSDAQADKDLQSYVSEAAVRIGQPIVYPFATALPSLQPEAQVLVLGILEDIGYPDAMPYIKQVIEADRTDGNTRRIAESTLRLLSQRADVSPSDSSAEMHRLFGESYYRAGTRGEALPGVNEARSIGVVWSYDPADGMSKQSVPERIYPDVRSMQSAKASLTLNPELDASLSLYIAANLRRENRLPDGEQDPTYRGKPASFYAMLAGPLRVHEVLARALDDQDVPLALDAIEVLSRTSGDEILLNLSEARQPLLQALDYPDRRVRRYAAIALAQANPQNAFPGSDRVVPTLGSAVNQNAEPVAVVLASDTERTAMYAAPLEAQGYQVLTGQRLIDLGPALDAVAAVDLLVVEGGVQAVQEAVSAAGRNVKLSGSPVLAFAPDDQTALVRRQAEKTSRLTAAAIPTEGVEAAVSEAATQAQAKYAGDEVDAAEAEAMALQALAVLDSVVASSAVYRLAEVEDALIRSLADSRSAVAIRGGEVLAKVDSADAQRALAESASSAFGELQVELLGSLAESAKRFGNRLTEAQSQTLTELVGSAQGDAALAAARAHGALALPTAQSVQMIQAQ